MCDFKSTKFIFCFGPNCLLVLNKSADFGIANRDQELFEFGLLSFGDQFDSTIVEIADCAGDFKTGCDRLHGVAKSNSLHTPRKEVRHSLTFHVQL